MSRISRQHHRLRDPALLSKPMIGFIGEIGDAPLPKKFRSYAFGCRFIRDMLRAVFAKLRVRALAVRLGPGTTRTIEPILLVELQERTHAACDAHLIPGGLGGSDY